MKVDDESYFKDHIASRAGYDLALSPWLRLGLPGHRRPPHLRQADPGSADWFAHRRAELHPPQHRTTPTSSSTRPSAAPSRTPDERSGLVKHADARICGRGRLHPALPAA